MGEGTNLLTKTKDQNLIDTGEMTIQLLMRPNLFSLITYKGVDIYYIDEPQYVTTHRITEFINHTFMP